MLKLLSDENFNNAIVRGLFLRHPNLNLIRIQDANLSGAADPDVLNWAAENDRIILTHDRATMAEFAYERLIAGKSMPGLFVLGSDFPIGRAIDEILLMDADSDQAEWNSLVIFLPL